MHRSVVLLIAGLLVASSAGAAPADDPALERLLIDVPTAQGALDDSSRLNEEPHYAGTVGDHDMALWMRDKLQSYGFDARIEPVYTQVPQLKRAVLQLMVNPAVDFDLKEVPIASDPDGTRLGTGVPFNGWSGSGEVTAPLVYANRGLDTDYQTLAGAGVSVQGRIVLVRYGAQFRGELAARAQARGAAGVIFYSDPSDRDGIANGAPYPDGPYRPLGSVQRGSLGKGTMKIPVLPVTAITARRLLQEIAGEPGPDGWHGGLDADYAVGSTRAQVHLRVDESDPWITIWNTVGTLPGLDTSHEIVLGGHRDAWVYGVTDNGSGISTLLEAARALGFIYHAGWRPHYSIVIAGWDGEEIGEVGSDSYVRTHEAALRRGCLAYVNADETATGRIFDADAAAALDDVTPHVARLVPDPRVKTRTVWEGWQTERDGAVTREPGGGSDHEPFLYLLGIPTLQFGFAGPFGTYHSGFDDLRYAMTQADPGFNEHRTLAQMLALTAYRMTLGPLPYRVAPYATQMQAALDGMATVAGSNSAALAVVGQAVDRFATRSAFWDSQGGDAGVEIEAVRRLDLLLYGRNGYASVPFPQLSAALATGDSTRVTAAANQAAAAIDAIGATLH